MRYVTVLNLFLLVACTGLATAQGPQSGHSDEMAPVLADNTRTAVGPHGGSLKVATDLLIETVVDQSGIQMYAFNRQGAAVAVDQGRGVAVLRVEGNAKRYRYDLLPDGKGGLLAPVNLSQIAGLQIEIDVQLVGVGASGVRFKEVAAVPASEMQLAGAAIARQKICPVSGKPLGSMGQPVSVDVAGQSVYVCCAGCVDAVKAEPAKYASGRPEITVAPSTAADAAAIAAQEVCPVMDEPLGGMGKPVKVTVGDKPIFLCCKGCIKKVQAEPSKYLAMVYGTQTQTGVPAGTEQVRDGIFKVSAADSPFIAAQKMCPVMDEPLDAMGGPYKVHANGKAVYICCPGCAKKIAANPEKYLAVLQSQGVNAPVIR